MLESLGGRVLAQNSAVWMLARRAAGAARPTRMVGIGNLPGIVPQFFFPGNPGMDYELPDAIASSKPHWKDYTLFTDLDHGVKGGHFAMGSFLSGVRTADPVAGFFDRFMNLRNLGGISWSRSPRICQNINMACVPSSKPWWAVICS